MSPLALAVILLSAPLSADDDTSVIRQRIDVVGVTPIDGIGVERERFPANVQRLGGRGDDVSSHIGERAASVQQSEAQGNRWQRDLLFRGFLASPLLGAPEGLAVFRDGVRINEPFGDTVNWDTLPDAAIRSIELIPGSFGSFGLNALGGVVALRTKDGLSDPETSLSVTGGSFGTLSFEGVSGWSKASLGHFMAVSHAQEDGWRDHSPSERTGFFASSVRTFERGFADVRVNLARSSLIGNGAAPIQLLDERRSAVFTHPDLTRNRSAGVTSAMSRTTPLGTLEGNIHWRQTSTRGSNGDDTPYESCEDDASLLCLDDIALVDDQGAVIRIAPGGRFDAVLNRNQTRQQAYGATAQLSHAVASRHRLIGGASIDGGSARFTSWSEIGRLTASRGVESVGITPASSRVGVDTMLLTTAAFVAGIFELTPRIHMTTTLRANRSRLVLDDRIGTALDGDHRFTSINPSFGFAWATAAGVLFGGVNQSSRTPTPVELTCADEEAPCRLPNAFLSDPPLEQVIARTVEAGFRRHAARHAWSAALFRTANRDDIIFVSSGRHRGEGHFENAGRTLREGVELIASGNRGRRLDWYANYSLIRATFRDTFVVASPHHPNGEGSIPVRQGDTIPQIPLHTAKAGVVFRAGGGLALGAHVRSVSGSYYRGDEANLTAPLPGYTIVDLSSGFEVAPRLRLDLALRNATNVRYATFGTFGEADDILGDEYDDPRFITPGEPRNIRLTLTWRR